MFGFNNSFFKKMKGFKFIFFGAIVFLFTACKEDKKIYFSGYDLHDTLGTKIVFDSIQIEPEFLHKKMVESLSDTNFYWQSYQLNKEFEVIHHCSSYFALITGNACDSISILNHTFSVSNFFGDNIVKFRITNLYKFHFEGVEYLLILGNDMFEGGNRAIDNVAIIARLSRTSISLFCPPLNLNAGASNTQPFFPNYINDFNRDHQLDFVQWNEKDTIALFSIINDSIVKQPEFIKLSYKENGDGLFYFDKKNSNWPYPYFKSSASNQIIYSLENSVLECKNEYYHYPTPK